MIDGLAIAATVLALGVAIWAFIECARHRPPTRALFAGIAVVGVAVLFEVVVVAVHLAGGDRPLGGGGLVTLLGYLLTALLLPPAGIVLARMEPTRWGSALIGAAALIVPVLLLRIGQVYGA